jgi:hypothetical protein
MPGYSAATTSTCDTDPEAWVLASMPWFSPTMRPVDLAALARRLEREWVHNPLIPRPTFSEIMACLEREVTDPEAQFQAYQRVVSELN